MDSLFRKKNYSETCLLAMLSCGQSEREDNKKKETDRETETETETQTKAATKIDICGLKPQLNK